MAVPFARKVGWGWDHEISVGRRGGEGQNFLRLRRASSYCVTPYSRTTHVHAHTQTHTRLFLHKRTVRIGITRTETSHRSAMQAFLLLFGLLFRPGASVRLKTVGESWDGPTLDGPQAIIPLSQLYPALTQDQNATWFTIHTVGTFKDCNPYSALMRKKALCGSVRVRGLCVYGPVRWNY